MKPLSIFPLMSCFVMIMYFLIFSFSDIAVAEKTSEERIKNCMSCCAGKKQICINIKADLRLCEAVFQTCIATCNSEGNIPSEWDDCWSQSDR